MKARIALLALLLIPASATAQIAAITNYCVLGASQATTSGLNSSNYMQGVIPSCTVTVYLTGTTNLATIYADSLSTPLTNPFIATSAGSFLFYAFTGAAYDVVLSGGFSPNVYLIPVTLTDLSPGLSNGGTITGNLLVTGKITAGTLITSPLFCDQKGVWDVVACSSADNTGATVTNTQLQSALNSSHNLYFPDGTYLINGISNRNGDMGGLAPQSNTTITCSANAILQVQGNASTDSVIWRLAGFSSSFPSAIVSNNVTIQGCSMVGDVATHLYQTTPVSSVSGTGGTIAAGTYYAKIVAIMGSAVCVNNETLSTTCPSGQNVSFTTTGSISSVSWTWPAVSGATSYQLWVGPSWNGETSYFTSATNSYTQTTTAGTSGTLPTAGEWGFGVSVFGASGTTLINDTLSNFWGDGIQLNGNPAEGNAYPIPTATVMNHVVSTNNRRQGMSITNANGVKVTNSTFSGTGSIGYTPPGAGVDIEPCCGVESVSNVVFENTDFTSNLGLAGLVLSGNAGNISSVDVSGGSANSNGGQVGGNGYQIYGSGSTNVRIHDTTASNNTSSGHFVLSIGSVIEIDHNTDIGNASSSTLCVSGSNGCSNIIVQASSNVQVDHNTAQVGSNASKPQYGLQLLATTATQVFANLFVNSGNTGDYNDFSGTNNVVCLNQLTSGQQTCSGISASYLPLSGGTLTGPLIGTSITLTNAFTGTSGTFNGPVKALNGQSLEAFENGSNGGTFSATYVGSGSGAYTELNSGDSSNYRPIVLGGGSALRLGLGGNTTPTWSLSAVSNFWGVDLFGTTHQAGTAPTISGSGASLANGTNAGGIITLATATSATITFSNSGYSTWAACTGTLSTGSTPVTVTAQSKTACTLSFPSTTGTLNYHVDGN